MMTNEDMFLAWANGDNSMREKLILENQNLVYKVMSDMTLYYDKEYSREDYASIGTLGLISAIDSFHVDKGTFSTYAYHCIFNEIVRTFQKNSVKKRVGNFETVSYNQTFKNTNVEVCSLFPDNQALEPFKQVGRPTLQEALSKLSDEEYTFFKTHYIDGDSIYKTREYTMKTLNLTLGEFKSIDRKVRVKLARLVGVKYDPRDKKVSGNVDKILN